MIAGFGSGWDVIVPAGWGVPVWLGLVYRGARAGGLRESQHLSLEMCQGPALQPDTLAGRKLTQQQGTSATEKHFRYQPASVCSQILFILINLSLRSLSVMYLRAPG